MNDIKVKDDVLIINTNPVVDSPSISKKIAIFDLVPENHAALTMCLPEFDFKNAPVNPVEFASSLVETCKKHNGLGLSANQCGYNYRVFVMGSGDEYVAFFNPKITSFSAETTKLEEGCLSSKDLFLNIERPTSIEVEYQDYNGITKTAKFAGLTARCFQHELDHLNGIVYTTHVKPLAMQMAMKKRIKLANQRDKLQKQMINKVKEKFNVPRF
jgi:peptide deformylase